MRKAISCVLLALLPACGGDLADDSTDVDHLEAVSGPFSSRPDPLVFPSAIFGGNATYATVTLANNAPFSYRITAASATGAFWVTWGGTCNDTAHNKFIGAHGSCTLQFGFSPPAANSLYVGTGSVTFSNGLVLRFGLRGRSLPGLTATPDPLVFPTATFGGAATYAEITVNNNFSTTQTISGASTSGDPFWVTWGGTCNSALPRDIAPHSSCTLQFGFNPQAAGTTFNGSGTISFTSGSSLTFGLSGTSN